MAEIHGPKITTSGSVLVLDAASTTSYPGSGTAWYDLSGNGNNGTLTNGPTFNSANKGSIVFDGVDDYVTIPHSSTLSITYTITIEAWIYVTSANYNMIVTKQPSGGSPNNYPGNYELRTNPSNGFDFLYQVNTFNNNFSQNYTANDVLSLNKWNHICCVAGGNSYGNPIIYINSIAYSTTTIFTIGDIVSTNTNPVLVGKRQDGYPFNGRIALVRLYNRLLSANEVYKNYTSTKSRFGLL